MYCSTYTYINTFVFYIVFKVKDIGNCSKYNTNGFMISSTNSHVASQNYSTVFNLLHSIVI